MTAGQAGRTQAALGSGALASLLQEVLTAAVRVRADRQTATDGTAFRNQVKHLLTVAYDEARRAGYGSAEARLGIYAVVAFLDESALNSAQPMFEDWPKKPLQEELFGGHMGGEMFFQNARELLGRQDAGDVVDVLEVYQLCLLLGFRGRYASGEHGELRGLASGIAEKIARVRGARGELTPGWAPPPGEVIPAPRDPWLKRLALIAGGTALVALLLFVVWSALLGSGARELSAVASQLLR